MVGEGRFCVIKKLALLLTVIVLLVFSLPVSAADPEIAVGEVLYHQVFESGLSIERCGIRLGTAGSQAVYMNTSDDGLNISTYDTGRAYILLPKFYVTDSRTIEFSFRFDEKRTDNARLAVMLTCRGDEPTNITSVVFRAGGTVDGFTEPSDNIKQAISGGKTVDVKIPLDSGVLHEITVASEGEECILEKREVMVVSAGDLGFVLRNADATINDITVVSGVGYSEKTGYYVEKSYSDDIVHELPDLPDDFLADDTVYAPETGDGSAAAFLLSTIFAGFASLYTAKRAFKRKSR